MRDLLLAWWSWIGASSLQASVLLCLAWAIDRALVRRAWPQLLLTIWMIALTRLLLPPTIASPWSVTGPIGGLAVGAVERSSMQAPAEMLAALWIAGALVCLLARFLRRGAVSSRAVAVESSALHEGGCDELGSAWLAAVQRAARELGLSRSPRVFMLPGTATPAVTGLAKPKLLLPQSWLARSPLKSDRHALLHEIAHLKRADLWLDEACALVRALFWFHPLVWIALGRVRTLTELACDASVATHLDRNARRGEGTRAYRETLIRNAHEMAGRQALGASRGFLSHGSSIVLRIERLQGNANAHGARARACSALLAAALCACVLPMATPRGKLRAAAQSVFNAELSGVPQSCFSLQAAAMVLAADEPTLQKPPSK